MNWILVAMEASSTVVEAAPDANPDMGWWKTVALVALGGLGYKALSWISSWLKDSGKEWIAERFEKLQDLINKNSIMAQIQADEAVMKILEAAIPEVLAEIADTAKKDLQDGKFGKEDWDGLGTRLWEISKPHIYGGKNDYLKESSFEDGRVLAAMVMKKFFNKKKAKKEGLIDE